MKLATTEDLAAIEKVAVGLAEGYQNTPQYEIALSAAKKGVDPKFAVLVLGNSLDAKTPEERRVAIEDFLTDIARLQDDYIEDYGKEAALVTDGHISAAFA